MLDSTKKNAYNIIGSKIFRKKIFFFEILQKVNLQKWLLITLQTLKIPVVLKSSNNPIQIFFSLLPRSTAITFYAIPYSLYARSTVLINIFSFSTFLGVLYVTANRISTNIQTMMTKQRGWIPILNHTVSPSGRNREDGYPSSIILSVHQGETERMDTHPQ